MATLFGMYPFLLKLYADGGYQGPQFQDALQRVVRQVNVEIVKRSDAAKGFTILPKRRIVERTIDWHQSMPQARVPPLVINSHDAPKTLSNHQMISDRV